MPNALTRSHLEPRTVIGIGVDFTSCMVLPTLTDHTPLCQVPRFACETHAWPKLWKHQGAKSQTTRMNEIAQKRRESFLRRYGGMIGLEWVFPQIPEVIEEATAVAKCGWRPATAAPGAGGGVQAARKGMAAQ
jgi:L-ribulokinase